MPHRPNTTDGTAASRSITEPAGRRHRIGAKSVRYKAMPTLTGTAMTSPMAELSTVPQMKARAPNCSAGGFHVDDVKKLRTMCRNAGAASWVVEMAMRARMTSTVSPHSKVTTVKTRSATGRRRALGSFADPGGLVGVEVAVAVKPGSRRDQEGVELGLGLVEDVGRQLGVVDRSGLVLAGPVDVLQERLEGGALGLVGLVLVGDDPGRRGDRVGGVAGGVQRVVAEVGVHRRLLEGG